MGTAPTELINVTASAHRTFDPRTSLAGRRARSMRAATLSTPSNTPPAMISRRGGGLSSFHFFLATTTASAGPIPVTSPRRRSSGQAVKLASSLPYPRPEGGIERTNTNRAFYPLRGGRTHSLQYDGPWGVARGRDRRLWGGAYRRAGRGLGVVRRGSDGCRTRNAAGPGRGLLRPGTRVLPALRWCVVRRRRRGGLVTTGPSTDKAAALLALHAGPGFVLPNAWDAGSARILEQVGFPAIATTSAGIAWSCGVPDGEALDRDRMLEHVGRIVAAVGVPVTADLEAGYGDTADDVGRTVARAVELGAAGGNLEDAGKGWLFGIDEAVDRLAAARAAAPSGTFVLNARTDTYFAGTSGDAFAETVERAVRYVEAGADCVFVPGVVQEDTIRRLAAAIPGPLNVVAGQSESPPRSAWSSTSWARSHPTCACATRPSRPQRSC